MYSRIEFAIEWTFFFGYDSFGVGLRLARTTREPKLFRRNFSAPKVRIDFLFILLRFCPLLMSVWKNVTSPGPGREKFGILRRELESVPEFSEFHLRTGSVSASNSAAGDHVFRAESEAARQYWLDIGFR